MKAKDVAKKNGHDAADFEKWLYKNASMDCRIGFSSIEILENEDQYVQRYKQHFIDEQERANAEFLAKEAEKKKAEEERARKRMAFASTLVTSGFNFDGYKVVKYSGFISGDGVETLERGRLRSLLKTYGNESTVNFKEEIPKILAKARREAIMSLKEAAYNLGCNAVIGVDFDYINLEPEMNGALIDNTTYLPYIFCVTANGNAVVIEKE